MKKLISMVLALAMILSLLGVNAMAASDTPFELVAEVSSDKSTVTLSLKTDDTLSFANFDMTLTCPDGFTLPSDYTQGADYNAFEVNSIDYGSKTGVTSLGTKASSKNANIEVASGKTFLVYTVTVPNDVEYGQYTFSAKFTDAADYAGNALSWKGKTITSNAVTLGTHTHTYGDPTWEWTKDDNTGAYTGATATFTCTAANCDATDKGKTEVTASLVSETTKDASCKDTGTGKVTAKVTFNNQEYTDVKDDVIIALGAHTLTQTAQVDPTCYQTGKKAYWTCSVCENVFADAEGSVQLKDGANDASLTIPATGNHVYGSDGNCTTSGCTAKAPAYTAYYEVYDADGKQVTANIDSLYGLDVTAGSTYTVKVFLKAGSTDNNKLTSYILNLTYPSEKMTVVNDTTVQNYDSVAVGTGTINYQKWTTTSTTAGSTYDTIATTGTQVAQFKITLNSDLAANTSMTLGFSGESNDLSKNVVTAYQSVTPVAITTTSQEIGTLSQVEVTWNPNGGTINGSKDSTKTNVTYGTAATKPTTDPVRAGYTFDGWYLATDSNEAVITDFPNLTAATEYKAKWTAKSYTITYGDLDGGKLDNSTTPGNGSYTTETESLPTPTKDGYTFLGWKITAVNGETDLSAGNTVYTSLKGHYGNVTLKAVWQINASAVNVDYDYAGGAMNGHMLIVSALPESDQTVFYGGTELYYVAANDAGPYTAKFGTDGAASVMENASGVYVTLITGEYDASKLTISTGTSETLTFNNDVNEDKYVNAIDAMIVYQMLYNRANLSADVVTIKMRLLADIDHDFTADTDDLNTIATAIGNLVTTT